MSSLLDDTELIDVPGGKGTKIFCYKYKIRAGDYLSAIAARFNTSVEEIMSVNQNKNINPYEINSDQVIYVPKK